MGKDVAPRAHRTRQASGARPRSSIVAKSQPEVVVQRKSVQHQPPSQMGRKFATDAADLLSLTESCADADTAAGASASSTTISSSSSLSSSSSSPAASSSAPPASSSSSTSFSSRTPAHGNGSGSGRRKTGKMRARPRSTQSIVHQHTDTEPDSSDDESDASDSLSQTTSTSSQGTFSQDATPLDMLAMITGVVVNNNVNLASPKTANDEVAQALADSVPQERYEFVVSSLWHRFKSPGCTCDVCKSLVELHCRVDRHREVHPVAENFPNCGACKMWSKVITLAHAYRAKKEAEEANAGSCLPCTAPCSSTSESPSLAAVAPPR